MAVDGRGERRTTVFPRLVRVLEWQGRTNRWLAGAGGTSVSYLYKVMTGETAAPYHWMVKVALLLGVPVEILFPEEAKEEGSAPPTNTTWAEPRETTRPMPRE